LNWPITALSILTLFASIAYSPSRYSLPEPSSFFMAQAERFGPRVNNQPQPNVLMKLPLIAVTAALPLTALIIPSDRQPFPALTEREG
jgi:hypothetical protein